MPYQTRRVTAELTSADLAVLSDRQLAAIDAWWRACNYLTIGQIYLKDNPLLERPLRLRTSSRDCSATGAPAQDSPSSTPMCPGSLPSPASRRSTWPVPGHGGPALVAASWLEGTYSEIYPEVSQDRPGMHAVVPAVLHPRRYP